MRRAIILHSDVMEVLAQLRAFEPDDVRFEQSLRSGLDMPLFRAAYDWERLFEALNDRIYKVVKEHD